MRFRGALRAHTNPSVPIPTTNSSKRLTSTRIPAHALPPFGHSLFSPCSFRKTYFEQYPGRYFTGDGAVKDAEGDVRILGRTDGAYAPLAYRAVVARATDTATLIIHPTTLSHQRRHPLPFLSPTDVINVSGHRLGTAEVEAALGLHSDVAEAAVVGFPHKIKGEGIYSYVVLKVGAKYTPELQKELVQQVRAGHSSPVAGGTILRPFFLPASDPKLLTRT